MRASVTVVQAEPKFTAKVPRVLFKEMIEKFTDPPAVIAWDAGVISRLLGPDAVTVPETFELIVTVAVVPPFFLIDNDDGLIETVQPPLPPPVTGGPAPPDVPLQSAVLLWTVDPLTTELLTIPDVVLTVP